ncbi:uncharacterized protein [Montipora foliosa]|uniref:uncharacterized protein n=1 Tax=Montipora foliosa TaxID=591990 RepID=UPI0035F1B032
MANVIAVAESSDTSSIKVMFSNLSAGVRLDLGKFDILANDFSKQFMGYTVSSRQFADRFNNQTVDERPSNSLSPVVSDVVSQGGSQDRTNEPSSHAGKRKPGLEVNEEPRTLKRAIADDHQRDETDGAFIKKVERVFSIPASAAKGSLKRRKNCVVVD